MAVFDADRPLRVAVLFSGGASGFRYLAEHDPAFGEAYEVVCGVTSDPGAAGVAALRAAGVPVEAHDIEAFYADRGADTDDLEVREAFDRETLERLEAHGPDVVLLSGYMWIVTPPLLEAYPTVNVHPADLTVTDADGGRRYAGIDPVMDAIRAGEPETRSSVHFVTPTVDAGPVVVRSAAVPVHGPLVSCLEAFGAESGLRDYADAHQEWMKWAADGPAIAAALSLVAAGRVEHEGARVLIDGEPGYHQLE